MTAGRILRWIITLVGTLALTCGTGLREDELECEQVAAHLEECCPVFDPTSMSCTYSDGGYCGAPSYPALLVAESQCILELDCSEVRERGLCEDVAELLPRQEADGGLRTTAVDGGVCP